MLHYARKTVVVLYSEDGPLVILARPVRRRKQDHGSRQAREGRLLKRFR